MSVPTVPGYPDYTQAGTNKNIPWAFSKKTIIKFYDSSVVPQITNTDYEGEVKGQGDKVVINTVPDIAISKYQKGSTINWQLAESPAVELTVNRAIQFAFKMDKIDMHQFLLKNYMDICAQDAAEQQKIYIDTEYLGAVYADANAYNKGIAAGRKSGAYNLGTTASPVAITKTNIIDLLINLGGVADEQNWHEANRFVVLPSWMAVLLKQSDLKDASMTGDGRSTLRTGRLGMLDRWTLYGTNLYTSVFDTPNYCYNVLFGHKSGVCFVSQMVETEYFDKLETTFGKGMKGLQVYDWKVTKPESLGVLYCYKA